MEADGAAAAPSVPPPVATGRRALADVVVQAVGRLGNGLLGIVVLVLLARGLGTADLGRWTTLLAVIGLAAPLTEVGISQVAIGRAAARPEEEAGWLGALVALRIALGLVLTLATVIVVLLLADGSTMRVAGAVVALTVALGGLSAYAVVFQLRVRNDLTVLTMTVNSVVWTAGVVLVSLAGGGLVAFAIAFVVAAACSVALQVVLARRRADVRFAGVGRRARELIRVGLPLSVGTVFVIAYGRLDQLMVFGIAGEAAAGLYGAAYRILDQAIVVPLSVVTTMYPLLAAAKGAGDDARVRFLLQRALEALAAVSFGAIAFAIPCGGDALQLLFGAEFAPAGPTLAILMGAFALVCLGYLNGSLVLLHDLGKWMLAFSAVGLVVNVALNAVLIGPYGYVAAAWVTFGTELVVVLLTSAVTLRTAGWRPELGRLLRVAVAAALTSAALAALTALDVPVVLLLVLLPVLYGGLLLALGGIRLRETIAVVRPGSRA